MLLAAGPLAGCGGSASDGGAAEDAHDPSLSAIAVSNGRLTTSLAAHGRSQQAQVSAAASAVQVIPTARADGATVTVQGQRVESGKPSAPVALKGASTVVTIVVIAPDGQTGRSYSLTLRRAAAR